VSSFHQIMTAIEYGNSLPLQALVSMQDHFFGDMVKAVVDVKRGVMAVDAELHADLQKYLLQEGSEQFDLWGINLYPELEGDDFIEFDSLINIRPYQNNPGRYVFDSDIREKIKGIVEQLIV